MAADGEDAAGAPDVSFVVTLFNKRPFLPFLLWGLGAQEAVGRAQYIFVDDGSTDGTPEALRQAVACWPGVTILTQPNAGPAAALNRGLALATGRFVKPVDGDDMLLPWAVARMVAALEATGCEAALAPVPDQPEYDPDGPGPAPLAAGLPRPAAAPARLALLPLSLRRAQATPSHWLLTRALLRRIGGCDPGVFIQDYSLELRIAAAGDVARVPGPLLCAPRAAPGRMSDNQAQTLHDLNRALLRFLRRHPELPAGLRRLAIRRAVHRAASWGMRHGGQPAWGRLSLLRLPAALGLLGATERTEELVSAPFRATHAIRRP